MKPKNKFLTFYFLQQVIVSCIMCNKTTIFFAVYLPAHVFLRTSSSTLATLLMDPSVTMKTCRGYERCMGCWYTQDSAPSRLVPRMSALILWTYSYACVRVT